MQKARPAPSHVEERHGGMEARSRMVLRRPKAKAAELQIGDCKLQIANWGTGFAGLMASCCHSLAAPILAPLSRAPAGERVQQRVLMDHDAAAAKRSRKRSPSGARLFLFARLMPASPSAPSPGVPGEGVSCSPLRALTARKGVNGDMTPALSRCASRLSRILRRVIGLPHLQFAICDPPFAIPLWPEQEARPPHQIDGRGKPCS